MHELPDFPQGRTTLSSQQRRRLESARRVLAVARITDLASLRPGELIELVERLRSGLDDAVLVIDETTV